MSAIGKNPYQPPVPEGPAPEPPALTAALPPQQTQAPDFVPSAGRRVTSTIICTGGIVWCLMSAAVFLQTLWSATDSPTTNLRGELLVCVLFGAVGITIFALGIFIRRNQQRRVLLTMLVMLMLLVLFTLIAIPTIQ